LYYTGYTRSSTEVLKNVTAPDTDTLNPLVREAEVYLLTQQYYRFMEIIKEGWKEKKRTSKNVLENPKLVELDKHLLEMEGCVAHKLCGAGNGGFFLAFFEKEARVPEGFHKIQPTINGVKRII
jgi:galactokinase/mevalonate kinase-like predicted kinase